MFYSKFVLTIYNLHKGFSSSSSATDNIYSLLAEEAKTDDGKTEVYA